LRGAHFYTGAPTYGPQHIEGLQFVRNAAGDTLWLSGSRSPDGSRVVFAISTSTQAIMPFVQAEKVTPSAYQVLMRPTEGSGVQSIAYGYAPAFLDDTHISYFTDAGIAVMDTQTGEATLLFRYPAGTVLSSGVRYSPDRRTVLWTDAMTGESVAGSITPSAYTPLSTFKDLASPVLGNAAVYELRRTHEGQELWKRTLDGSSSAKVLTLPASLSILTMAL
ncbi:MAG TPA: hypothetical protein VEA36_01160, partial [Candidatus Paceibacterota bacterium]|nr:hypothetical protein [Candidatus Paceibacterota bacterium]